MNEGAESGSSQHAGRWFLFCEPDLLDISAAANDDTIVTHLGKHDARCQQFARSHRSRRLAIDADERDTAPALALSNHPKSAYAIQRIVCRGAKELREPLDIRRLNRGAERVRR